MHDLYHRLKPLGRILDLHEKGWTVWDCSPIRADDGRVHVFATRWRSTERPDSSWYHGSQIVHAVADRPEGPYELRDIVIDKDGGAGHWDSSAVINTKIYRVGDRYCLLYTGCTDKRHDTQAVGMLLAPSLHGPWEPVSESPIIAPDSRRSGFDGYLCNNPALVVHPDGGFWIYYKGRPVVGTRENGNYKPGTMAIGLAIADKLEGPYRKHATNPVIAMEPHTEDPYVWHDGRTFWMLLSTVADTQPGGWLLSSSDGFTWSEPRPGYPSAARFSGRKQRLEEPNLLFTGGRLTHLFNVLGACPADDAYSGFVFEITASEDISR